MLGRQHGGTGIVVWEVEDVGASGVTDGVTGLLLSLGALVGSWPASRIQAALAATPVKHVIDWCQENLPSSVQPPRPSPFGTDDVNKTRTITPPEQYQIWRA